MNCEDMIRSLCVQGGPSGFERSVSKMATKLLEPLVDQVSVDSMNNVIGVKPCGRPNAPRLVLDAHLDEVGLAVTGIENGFLRFCTLGGVDVRILPGSEVRVLSDPPLKGIVTCTPPHLADRDKKDKAIPVTELLIDVGLCQERAAAGIPLGTPVVYADSLCRLGPGKLCGKSMDDRACFAALLRTLELLEGRELDVDLYVLGSSFEEVGGTGAKTAVYSIAPDWCVAVDVTHGQTPDGPSDLTFKLGGGPVIGLGPNINRWMSQRFKQCAENAGIDYQLEVMGGHSGTNAWPIQISRQGIATAVLSLPLRYMHTPVEVLSLSDLEQLAKLLAEFITGIGKEGKVC